MTLRRLTVRRSVLLACLFLAGASLGRPALADPSGHSAVALYESAIRIGDFGGARGDPFLLVAAARTLIALGGSYRALGLRRGRDLGANAKPPRGPDNRQSSDMRDPVERLLADAHALAGDDAALRKRIEATRAARSRGRRGGPGRWQGRIDARSYVELDVELRGAELAEVFAVGDGESDIDLAVFARHGEIICESTGESDRESCRWTPERGARFTVRVTNYGKVWNFVTIVTN